MKKNYTKRLLVTMCSFGIVTGWGQCTDDLNTTSSDLDGILCQGEELTLTATSENGGTVSWDGGVVDGEAFTPPVGTTTYTVSSDNAADCPVSIEITVNGLPEVEALSDAEENTICEGQEVVLTGAGATTYAWDMDVEDGVAISPEGTATYTVTGTDDNGCENTAEIEVVVNALPEVEALSDAEEDAICEGEDVVLTGAGANTYEWDMEVVDGEAFMPEGTATYTVIGTDANGCENSAAVEVVVNPIPEIEASADEDVICLGETVTLTGSGADTYEWSIGVNEEGEATPTESGEVSYTLTGTTAGCDNRVDIIITVNALPEVVATSNDEDNAICIGEEITLNGEGAESYDWDMGVTNGEAFAPEVGTVTYTVTGVDENMCENTAEIEIIVNALPEVTASVSSEEICLGESVVFNGGGADTYEWDMEVVDGEAFTPGADGTVTYTVTGTDENGCVNTATVDLIVNTNPLPEVTASVTEEEICLEDVVTFTGGGAETYEWDNEVVDGEAYIPGVPGMVTYTVVGTAENGCTNSASVDVLINALPEVEATVTEEEICIGGNVTFNGAGDEGVVYVWTEGVADGEAFTPAATGEGVYEVTGTDGNGCVSTDEVTVMVNGLPEVLATVDDEEICLGDDVVFTGEGAETYVWTGGVEDGVAFEPGDLGTETYEVTGTDENGCVNTDEIEVLVNALPAVSGTASAADVCLGESYVLTGESEFDFSWGGDIEDGEAVTQELSGDYTHIITAVSPEGCIGIDMVSVTVHELPTVEAGLDQTHCADTEIALSGSGAETYVWDGGITDGVDFAVEAGETTYTVTGTDENGCTGTDEVVITGISGPTVTGVVTNESASFNGAIDVTITGGVGPFGFEWDHGPTTEDVDGLTAGSYTISVSDSGIEDGLCPAVEETFVVISTIGVEEFAGKNVSIYPTPATENITIEFAGEFNYELTAINGDVVYTGVAVDKENVALYELPAGIYLVKIVANGETITKKIVKQ